jgi:hypothetical protein
VTDKPYELDDVPLKKHYLYYSQFRLSDKPKPDDVGLRNNDRILSRIPRPLLPDGADVEPLPPDVPLPNNNNFSIIQSKTFCLRENIRLPLPDGADVEPLPLDVPLPISNNFLLFKARHFVYEKIFD